MTRSSGLHVVFAGGGTAGHLFPGLAVAQRLVEIAPNARITFAGSGRPLERREVEAAGFAHLPLRCRPWTRRPRQWVPMLLDNLAGFWAARRFLAANEAAMVVGLGGYASVPMARAAVHRHVPLVLLEQNVVPGRATRWLSRWAALVCTAFPETECYLKARCPVLVAGNPVRSGFARLWGRNGSTGVSQDSRTGVSQDSRTGVSQDSRTGVPQDSRTGVPQDSRTGVPPVDGVCRNQRDQRDAGPTEFPDRRDAGPTEFPDRRDAGPTESHDRQLAVLGGSAGAQGLNDLVPRALDRARLSLAGWRVVHQSGQRGLSPTRELYTKLGIEAAVIPFVADMAALLGESDLAISRAGGTTLAELAAAGVPAILLPYPHAADDHQRKNADAFTSAGGTFTLDPRGIAGPPDRRLAEVIAPLLTDPARRAAMAESIRRLARPGAAGDIADRILALATRRQDALSRDRVRVASKR